MRRKNLIFLNITHIQIHRRARALSRLRKLLSMTASSSSEDGTTTLALCPFSIQSLSNVLLPLAMHPIYDSNAKEEETYALEAIATVGAIAKHLPWGEISKHTFENTRAATKIHRSGALFGGYDLLPN